jgi:hypothetical protein
MGMDISPQERDRITRQADAAETRKRIIQDFLSLCLVWCAAAAAVIAVLGAVGLYLNL